MDVDENQVLLLKKKLKIIKQYKGQGTQLISLYLPPDADRSSVMKQLTDEISQSANIKSQQTRKNVQGALRRIMNYLKQIDFKLPETGIVLFSGEVSPVPSKSNIILMEVVPPKRLTTKLYWCDSAFHTAPLDEMITTEDVFGLIVIDKREATIGVLRGKSQEILGHETSGVPGKFRAGGQSAARFERLREKAAEDFFKRVGDKVNSIFVNMPKLKGIIVGGPGNSKEFFLEHADLDHRIKDMIIGKVDTGYTDETGIKEIINRSSELLKEVGFVKERNLINKFITQVAKDQLATYGYTEVMTALKLGKAETILVSEDLDWLVIKYQCPSCKKNIFDIVKDASLMKETSFEKKCPDCDVDAEFIEELDVYEYLTEVAGNMGTQVVLVSTETQEGKTFFETFGGLGALLRYR